MAADKRRLHDKLGKLTPAMQEIFLANIEQMLRQESTSMLRFIRESRADLNATVRLMHHGQVALRAAHTDQGVRSVAPARRHVIQLERPARSFSAISTRSVMTPSHIDLWDIADSDADDRNTPAESTDGVPQGKEMACFYREMTVDLIEGLAGETARIEEQRRLQSEQARKRWNTKRAKLQQVAQLFVQANTSVAEKEKAKRRQGEKLRQKIEERRNKIETTQM